jgi:hypothetical protein
MAMVCPQCNRSFDQHLQCPTCGTRLLYHAKLRPSAEGPPSSDPQWQYTPWGRILIGVVLAQGLAYGLQLLFRAGIQATGEEVARGSAAPLYHLILVQAIQAFSLLVGGILTGAGRRRGVFFGSIVGLLHGLIYLGIRHWNGEVLTEIYFYAIPVLHMAFGAVGGLIGSLIWRPLPAVNIPQSAADKKLRLPIDVRNSLAFLVGPVAWIRVLVGTALVVSGVVWASAILKVVLENAPVQLSLSSALQYELVTWEIAALVTFLGAALAGATTFNGFKQGLFVGLAAAVVLAGLHLARTNPDVDRAVLVAVSALFLSAGGGWFGGQLFPPIVHRSRRTADLLTRAG